MLFGGLTREAVQSLRASRGWMGALVIAAGVTVSWEWGRLVRKAGFDGIALIQAASVAVVAVTRVLMPS